MDEILSPEVIIILAITLLVIMVLIVIAVLQIPRIAKYQKSQLKLTALMAKKAGISGETIEGIINESGDSLLYDPSIKKQIEDTAAKS